MNRIEQRKKYKRIIFIVAAIIIAAIIYIFVSVVLNVTGQKSLKTSPAQTTETDGLIESNESITTVEITEETITTEMKTTKEIEIQIATKPSPPTETVSETEKITEKVTKKKKPKTTTTEYITETPTTKKPNNTIPNQREITDVIGKNNMSAIRNSIITAVDYGRNYSEEMEDLAIYMAKNNLSSASSAVNELCGYNTLNVAAKTATVTSSSTASEDILEAAITAVELLAENYEGQYGIGINAKFIGNEYKIYVVIAIKR